MDSNEMISLLSQILDEKIGMVTAYAYAKSKGYSGSADDFANDMANIGVNISAIETAINTFNNQTVPNAETAITTAGSNQVTAVNTAGQEQLQNVTAEGGRQVGLVAAAGSAQTEAVNTAGSTQISAVNGAGATQVGNVNTAGATQVSAIQTKGEETLETIPSDYTALSDSVEELKSAIENITQEQLEFADIVLPTNLFNYANEETCKPKYWYYSTTIGSEVTATSTTSTNNYCAVKIRVDYLNEGDKITFGNIEPTHKYVFWAGFTDQDMKLLSYQTIGQNDPVTVTIPTGAVYLLISYSVGEFNFTSVLPTVMAVRGETLPATYSKYFEPYYMLTDCETERTSETIEQIAKSGDLDITSSATKHGNMFYNVNNQFYAGGGVWDYYTLNVLAGDTFIIDTVAGGTIRGWAFRDGDGNQLSIATYDGEVVQKVYAGVAAPLNATELIINFSHAQGHLTIIKQHSTILNENRIVYNDRSLPTYLDAISNSNILFGKTLCCCGDSITYGADMDAEGIIETPTIEAYQWNGYTKKWTRWEADEPAAYGYQIAARNNMKFYNGGVSGATVQAKSGSMTVPGFSDADGEYTLLPNEIDYLTLFYGWNDTAVGTLGTIDDATNDSYYGGYNVVLPYLIDKYPYTKIALIVPFGTDVGHRQAIRELADKWGVACFDMMQGGTPLYYGKEPSVEVDADIVTANRAKFQANGAHPNYRGHYQIGTMLEQFLRGI